MPYTSQYGVMKSYPKPFHPSSHVHHGHGNLVKAIEEGTGGFIRVGYDATVAPEPDGFECYSQPGPFMDQLQAWMAFWDSPITEHLHVGVSGKTPGGQPKSCGMHVHVSGKLMTPITMANMLIFINNKDNAEFLTYIADRYNDYYSHIQKVEWDKCMFLYHSTDCKVKTRRNKKIKIGKPHSEALEWHPNVDYNTGINNWCCSHTEQFYKLQMQGYFVRGALWALPYDGTGDCEFRLFATPTCKHRFFANLEFVHALVEYCHLTGPREVGYTKFCEWLMEVPIRRIRYTNLFKWLREASYVEGLIPRRSKANGTGSG